MFYRATTFEIYSNYARVIVKRPKCWRIIVIFFCFRFIHLRILGALGRTVWDLRTNNRRTVGFVFCRSPIMRTTDRLLKSACETMFFRDVPVPIEAVKSACAIQSDKAVSRIVFYFIYFSTISLSVSPSVRLHLFPPFFSPFIRFKLIAPRRSLGQILSGCTRRAIAL